MEQQQKLPLASALAEIASVIEQIRTTGTIKLNGQQVKVGGQVQLELEVEVEEEKAELEIELIWSGATVETQPLVAILCGSKSDLPIIQKAADLLAELGISSEIRVLSAHRTPAALEEYLAEAPDRGIEVFIAGAGGAAHLAGVIASKTSAPVIGLPIPSEHLRGLDSLLSIVQMPKGVPVATVAIGGAENAALLAAQMLSLKYPVLRERLNEFRSQQAQAVLADPVAIARSDADGRTP